MSEKEVLKQADRESQLTHLPHWRYMLGSLRTAFKCSSSAVALELFAEIGALAQEANHHPDVDWRYDTLFVTLVSHDVGEYRFAILNWPGKSLIWHKNMVPKQT